MVMIPAQNLRTCIVCLYLIAQEVTGPNGNVVNKNGIECCWNTDGKINGFECDDCVHFANIHKELSKGGDNHVQNAVEAHQKAHTVTGTRPCKGKGTESGRKCKEAVKQLEFDTYTSIKT